MSKIKFNLVSLEQALAFQVTYMDERFLQCEYITNNKFIVKSQSCPSFDMDCNIIYLRGFVLERHLDVTVRYFKSNIERDIYKNKMVEALKDWTDNWEGWPDKKESAYKEYEF